MMNGKFFFISLMLVCFAACSSPQTTAQAPTDGNISSRADDCLISGDCEEEESFEEEAPPESDGTTEPVVKEVKPVRIKTAKLKSGIAGQEYSQEITAAGGSGKYVWTIDGGADEFDLVDDDKDDDSAMVKGKTLTFGAKNLTVTVSDAGDTAKTATKTFNFDITEHIALNAYRPYKRGLFGSFVCPEIVVEEDNLKANSMIFVPCNEKNYRVLSATPGGRADSVVIPAVDLKGPMFLKFEVLGHGKDYKWKTSKDAQVVKYHPVKNANVADSIDTSVMYLAVKGYPSEKDIDLGQIDIDIKDELESEAKLTISSLKLIGDPCAGVSPMKLDVSYDPKPKEHSSDNELKATFKVSGGKGPYDWSGVQIYGSPSNTEMTCAILNDLKDRHGDTMKVKCTAAKASAKADMCRAVTNTQSRVITVKDQCDHVARRSVSLTTSYPSITTIGSLIVIIKASDIVHTEDTVLKVQLLKDKTIYGETVNFTGGYNDNKNVYGAHGSDDGSPFDTGSKIYQGMGVSAANWDIPISEVDKIVIHVEDNICGDCSPLDVDVEVVGITNFFCYQVWEDGDGSEGLPNVIDEDIAGKAPGRLSKDYLIMSKEPCADNAKFPGCWNMGEWYYFGKYFMSAFD